MQIKAFSSYFGISLDAASSYYCSKKLSAKHCLAETFLSLLLLNNQKKKKKENYLAISI